MKKRKKKNNKKHEEARSAHIQRGGKQRLKNTAVLHSRLNNRVSRQIKVASQHTKDVFRSVTRIGRLDPQWQRVAPTAR